MVEGILAAAKDAGHDATGGYIRGMFGFFFTKGPVNNFTDASKSDSGVCVCVYLVFHFPRAISFVFYCRER